MANRSIRTGRDDSRLQAGRSSLSAVRKPARRGAGDDAGAFLRLKRAIRKAERRSGDGREIGGTGATILRFRAAPLARLIEKQRVGAEEMRAADDIAMAFHAQAASVMIKSPSLEKRDAAYHGHEPVWIIDAVSRYKRWARHWSQRARLGDRTLEILIAAVIDERAFHSIEADVGIRHGLAARVVIAGLRDYAARAAWTDRNTAETWTREAESIFALRQRPNM
ncbi:MAG TPA: hypothetical protein VKT99_10990 [Xanthobacteraceae bacterium]|jgi:hypothetical protein|nr:hypothetical protein [Xanthobacteraceae bacterium]